MPTMKRVSQVLGIVVTGMLGACAVTPQEPVSEALDPNTATTVIALNEPIELFSENTRGKVNDPFAYLAPFETDLQGKRGLFLWVSAPQSDPPPGWPQVICNGRILSLDPMASEGPAGKGGASTADLSPIHLSRPPYKPPVPWSIQWYFRLSDDDLKCLAEADVIAIDLQAPGMELAKFTAEHKNLGGLAAFTHH